MEFRNCESNADKVKLYENVRKGLTEIYEDSRVQERVKNLRQKFSIHTMISCSKIFQPRLEFFI